MSVVPRITCRRCGRQFSGLRSRCPYCGTRRVKQSDRAPGTTAELNVDTAAAARAGVNTKWQLIFGVILLVAVILAVIVLVSASLNGVISRPTPTPSALPVTDAPTPTPTPSPTPTPTVDRVRITFLDEPMEDFTTDPGSTVELKAFALPLSVDSAGAINWSSSHEEIATVEPNEDGTGVIVTGVSRGISYITAECFGVTAQCTVHVR